MYRSEIMSSTPEQLAERYSSEELDSVLRYYAPDDFGAFIGNARYTDLGGKTVTQEAINWCEQLLTEWFDENDEERPIDAEPLAIAYHLWAASCYAYDREQNA